MLYQNLEEAISQPYRYEKTRVTLSYCGELFTVEGVRNLELGRKKNRPDEAKELLLPKLHKGERIKVYGCTQSRYYSESAYPMEFLEVYRSDRAIDKELQGRTPQEREAYLKDLLGTRKNQPKKKSCVRRRLKRLNLSMSISANWNVNCSIPGHLLWEKACARRHWNM